MTDENKLSRAIDRQARAEDLMRNELLQECFTYLEKTFIDGWRRCEDPALRDELWRSQANLANLRKQISTVASAGKLAQAEIDLLTAKRRRFGVI
jgi:hypothetical protein